MKESVIQSKLLKELKERGAYCIKVIQANKAGVPDIIACYKGKFLGIEVKRPETKNNVSVLQRKNLEAINKANGYDAVIWELPQLLHLLERVDHEL